MFAFLGFSLFIQATNAYCQFTTVTAVVKDANGNLYQNCHGTADFVPSPNATTESLISGSTFQTSFPINQCDGNANLTLTGLVDNNQVSDGHGAGQVSQWRFTICSSGTPPICFNYTTTITGATQDISAGLKAASAPLIQPGAAGVLNGSNIWTGTNVFDNISATIHVDGSTAYPRTQVGIQNAVNAAGCNGKVVLDPGTFNLTDTVGTQEILLTNVNSVANCSIDFGGPGGEGVVILQYSVSVPNSEDIIRVAPGTSTSVFGIYLHDFFIQPASASTTAARYGINFDETNGLIAHVTVERVRIGSTGSFPSNYAVFNTNTVPSCNPLFLATFMDNTFWGGVNFNNVGDSILFMRNNITGPRDFTIQSVSTGCHTDGGAHGLQIIANNLTPAGGTIFKNAWTAYFAYNDIEQTATSTEANGALIDVQGLMAAPTQNLVIEGGYLGCNSSFGCINAIRVDQARETLIKNPYITRGSGAAILTTANADRTHIVWPTHAPNGEVITTWLSDSGTNTEIEYADENAGSRVFAGVTGFTGATNSTNRIFGVAGTQVRTGSGVSNCFSSGADVLSAGCDTGVSRISANVVGFGNGTPADASALAVAAAFGSVTANKANSGYIRHANTDKDCWRSSDNTADDCHGETQTIRGTAGCATAASIAATCTTTITWPKAFADTAYTPSCIGDAVTSGAPILAFYGTKLAGSIVVTTMALTASAAQFTAIECSATHD